MPEATGRIVKFLFFWLCHTVGLTSFFRWWNRDRVMILCYHGISDEPRQLRDPSGIHVAPSIFTRHIAYLTRHYNVVSLQSYLDSRTGGRSLPPNSVVLTFDDGYRNFFNAIDALKPHALPVSMFLVTDWTTQAGETRAESDFLSWEDVKTIVEDPCVKFGAHTASHRVLTGITVDEIRNELETSRDRIRQELNTGDALPFAYPKGACDPTIAKEVASAGFSCGLTTDGGHNDDQTCPFWLRRTLVGNEDDVPHFAARVSGLVHALAPVAATFNLASEAAGRNSRCHTRRDRCTGR